MLGRSVLPTVLMLAVSASALPATTFQDTPTADLILLDANKYPDAVCLDGSQGGYYFQASPTTQNNTNWIFSLEGGGECVTQDSCSGRAQSDLGSSRSWASSMQLGQLQDPHCDWNADFCNYNQVFVKYCSGDLHSGMGGQSWGLTFAGHTIVAAVLDDLKLNHGLSDADLVIFSGDSAGGIGAYLNLDFVADTLPDSTVMGAPIGGFYFPTPHYTGPGAIPVGVDFSADAWPGYTTIWNSYAHENCANAYQAKVNGTWPCMLAFLSFPYTKTPAFAIEAETDVVQMSLHDAVPTSDITPPVHAFIAEWGRNMTANLHLFSDSTPNGVFSAACLIHCDFGAQQPIVNTPSGIPKNFYQALGDWVFKRSTENVVIDDCGTMCNPTCPKNP